MAKKPSGETHTIAGRTITFIILPFFDQGAPKNRGGVNLVSLRANWLWGTF